MSADERRLNTYERQLRWALAALPEVDRESIVAETRSHVLDRIDAGADLGEILSVLGTPNDYACAFCESYEVARALSSRKTPRMLQALTRGWARSTGAVGALLVMSVVWIIALQAVFMSLLKLRDPVHVGLWKSEEFFFLGIIDDPSSGTELLGAWIAPLAFGCLIAAWCTTHWLAMRTLKAFTPQD